MTQPAINPKLTLTPEERARIAPMTDEHNQKEVDTDLAAQYQRDAQARKDKQNAAPTT